jgi:hypothetical protein
MAAIFETGRFGTMPLWAQVLIVSRMTRRATLATLPKEGAPRRKMLDKALDWMDECCARGEHATVQENRWRSVVAAYADGTFPVDQQPLAEAAFYAVDACRAAIASYDFPVDATVTQSARKCLASLQSNPRLLPIQILTIFASDVDQLCFACDESKLAHAYATLPPLVFQRLAPVHAFTLTEPRRKAEDDFR